MVVMDFKDFLNLNRVMYKPCVKCSGLKILNYLF